MAEHITNIPPDLNPKRSSRGAYEFFEVALADGPRSIGDTQDSTYASLFGREWMLVLDADTNMLKLYEQKLGGIGEWERVTSPIPAVFDSPLPGTARRIAFAFDQSARIIVTYEDQGSIYITRWDNGSQSYVQSAPFAGVEPALLMDATINGDVSDSDIVLFYLNAGNRAEVKYRIQREVYSIEYSLYTHTGPMILDRAHEVGLRYQLLVCDDNGDQFGQILLSDTYPYLDEDQIAVGVNLTMPDPRYDVWRQFLSEDIEDPVLIQVAPGDIATYELIRLLVSYDAPIEEVMEVTAQVTGDATYADFRDFFNNTAYDPEGISATVEHGGLGLYDEFRAFWDSSGDDTISTAVTHGGTGRYDEV